MRPRPYVRRPRPPTVSARASQRLPGSVPVHLAAGPHGPLYSPPRPPPSPGVTSNVAGVSNTDLLAASAGRVLPQDDGADTPASAATDPSFGLPVDMSALNSSANSLSLLAGGGLTLDNRPFFRCSLLCGPRHRTTLVLNCDKRWLGPERRGTLVCCSKHFKGVLCLAVPAGRDGTPAPSVSPLSPPPRPPGSTRCACLTRRRS